MLHRKLPLDTRPIRRPIRWIICPFVSIESTQQFGMGRHSSSGITERVHGSSINIKRGQQLRYGASAAPASPSAHSSSVITGRVQQLHQHRTRTGAPVWGATAAPASPSAHSSSDSIGRGQQLRYGAPQQLRHHRARTTATSTSGAHSSYTERARRPQQ